MQADLPSPPKWKPHPILVWAGRLLLLAIFVVGSLILYAAFMVAALLFFMDRYGARDVERHPW
jgi:hypothetical protein